LVVQVATLYLALLLLWLVELVAVREETTQVKGGLTEQQDKVLMVAMVVLLLAAAVVVLVPTVAMVAELVDSQDQQVVLV
jgi:hypothetical protein